MKMTATEKVIMTVKRDSGAVYVITRDGQNVWRLRDKRGLQKAKNNDHNKVISAMLRLEAAK